MFIPINKRAVGNQGELQAVKFMKNQGFKILQRNYLIVGGEIDIVCFKKPDLYVFVEVKLRTNSSFGRGVDSITTQKKQALIKCAQCYLLAHHLANVNARFDVIEFNEDIITWYENAFEIN
ncbi:MAG: YraN family protein [Clostridia bacterium]